MYVTVLLVIHVLGAVAGIGPTFAYGVLGSRAGRSDPAGALALLDVMLEIQRKVVTPVALVSQPVTGVLLIFATGRDKSFFRHEWLWISVLLYATILVLSYLVDQPALRRVVRAMREGTMDTPEAQRSLRLAKALGPVIGGMAVIIVVLMMWRPGDGPF